MKNPFKKRDMKLTINLKLTNNNNEELKSSKKERDLRQNKKSQGREKIKVIKI